MTLGTAIPLTIIRGEQSEYPVGVVDIAEGAILGDSGDGYARELVAGDLFIGHSMENIVNSAGSAGDLKVTRLRGRYRLEVTISGVLITDVKKEVYASDRSTYILTPNSSRVGVIDRYVTTNTAIVEFQTSEPLDESVDPFEITYGDILPGCSYQNTYELSATKNYEIGTRREDPRDGRSYKYAKSGAACYTGQLSAFYLDKAIATLCAAAVDSGASTITFAAQTFAADALKGGYISVFGNPGGIANNADCPFRRIVGNTVCSGTTITITVDRPFDRDIDNGQFCEVYYNPYSDVRLMSGGGQSAAGLAAVYISAASKYFWIQTWGPNWNAPHVASFNSGAYRDAYANGDGSISGELGEAATGKQRIGFCIQSGLTAGPLLMLQIDK